MTPPFITTTVYKYKPYAPWLLVAYCILLFAAFIFSSSMPPALIGVIMIVLVLVPVYAAIKPKSVFSIRDVDNRLLSISTESILWDGITIPVQDAIGLSIYLFAFENFRHSETYTGGLTKTASEFGDQNKLTFKFQGKEYDFTFYLADYRHYSLLVQIIQSWRDAGYQISARNAWEFSYIQKQVALYGQ